MIPALAKATIGVMGSGSDEHADLAGPLGALLARLEVNVLTGAGRGVMESVSRAYLRSRLGRGICIGIVPCADENDRAHAKPGYPNEFVELPIFTHLPYSGVEGQHDLSRNHINILSSTAVVALPGGRGTASEIELALRYDKPIIVLTSSDSLVSSFPAAARRTTSIDEVEEFLRAHLE